MSSTEQNVSREELVRYEKARSLLNNARSELEELQQSEAVSVFQKQLSLLQKRLVNDPASLRSMFIADGSQALIWEFQQPELGGAFTATLWNMLVRGDDMGTILQRFIWALPLKFKRKFIKAIDVHLSRALSDVQGPVGRLARRSVHSALHPSGGRARRSTSNSSTRAISATRASATACAKSSCSSGSRCCATSSATTSRASSAC